MSYSQSPTLKKLEIGRVVCFFKVCPAMWAALVCFFSIYAQLRNSAARTTSSPAASIGAGVLPSASRSASARRATARTRAGSKLSQSCCATLQGCVSGCSWEKRANTQSSSIEPRAHRNRGCVLVKPLFWKCLARSLVYFFEGLVVKCLVIFFNGVFL